MTQNNNKENINKLYIIGSILLVISVFRYFELSQYLTLSYIKESQQEFHALYLSNRGLVIAARGYSLRSRYIFSGRRPRSCSPAVSW